MSKFSYKIEAQFDGPWHDHIEGPLRMLRGYMLALCDMRPSPSPRIRLVRSDGKVLDELSERGSVSVGQIAGFPTAAQYERAGNEALEKARQIRERTSS